MSAEVRAVVDGWIAAIVACDLEGVVAHHTDDVVMFDVPEPLQVLRGLDAYRAAWPPFFGWLASGAVFEVERMDVTAGEDVAYAVAVLRCGTPAELAAEPDKRLRLTVGLRREGGAWLIAHEHHSFAQPL